MRKTCIALLSGAALSLMNAHAQDYLDAYQDYQAAREAGDVEAATEAAVRAFDQALAADVDKGTLGALAQNVIFEAMWREPGQAANAAAYILAQAKAGATEIGYSLADAEAIDAYIQYSLDQDANKRRELEDPLEKLYAEGTAPSYLRMSIALNL